MMKSTRRAALQILAAGLLVINASPTWSQPWPTRPITIIVPFDAGGTNDRIARITAPFLSKELGQPVTVINKPGAVAMLGNTMLLKANDNHTIAMTSMDRIPLNIKLFNADFKLNDFDTLNLSSGDYSQIFVSNESNIKSARDILDRLRRDPSSVSFAIQSGGPDIINFTIWLKSAGIDPAQVRVMNTSGGAPTRLAVLGKTVDVAIVGAEGNVSMREKIRALLVFSDTRTKAWPDVPTNIEFARENKLANDEWVPAGQRTWTLSTAFSKSNPMVRARWISVLEKIHKNPEVIEAFRQANIDITWYGADATSKMYMQGSNTMIKYVNLIQKK
jgi:tripartite-type tricarboxylate transporter receptor subunit TctC